MQSLTNYLLLASILLASISVEARLHNVGKRNLQKNKKPPKKPKNKGLNACLQNTANETVGDVSVKMFMDKKGGGDKYLIFTGLLKLATSGVGCCEDCHVSLYNGTDCDALGPMIDWEYGEGGAVYNSNPKGVATVGFKVPENTTAYPKNKPIVVKDASGANVGCGVLAKKGKGKGKMTKGSKCFTK